MDRVFKLSLLLFYYNGTQNKTVSEHVGNKVNFLSYVVTCQPASCYAKTVERVDERNKERGNLLLVLEVGVPHRIKIALNVGRDLTYPCLCNYGAGSELACILSVRKTEMLSTIS